MLCRLKVLGEFGVISPWDHFCVSWGGGGGMYGTFVYLGYEICSGKVVFLGGGSGFFFEKNGCEIGILREVKNSVIVLFYNMR